MTTRVHLILTGTMGDQLGLARFVLSVACGVVRLVSADCA